MLIEMNGYAVTLQRKPIKNINLRIQRTGEVRLTAPLKMPLHVITNFLHSKQMWIETHRHRLTQLKKPTLQQFITGEHILFQGKTYELQLRETTHEPRIEIANHQLHLFIKPNASDTEKHRFLKQWYHDQMQAYLPSLFDKWESIIGVNATQIRIKHMKSRWGSCHPIKKHITLNLRLIEKPLICLEYVIVHELVHLLEASHNQRFHALMTHYLPDWKLIKKTLH